MTAAFDLTAIDTKTSQERLAIDQLYLAVDTAWGKALRAVAELATMYGIDPNKLYVHDSNAGYDETRLYVADKNGDTDTLHEDEEVVKRFTTDADYLLDNSMFHGFFHRDTDEKEDNMVKVVS